MNTALEHRGTFWARELEVAGDRRGFATIPGDAATQLQFAMGRRAAQRRRRAVDQVVSAGVSMATGILYSQRHKWAREPSKPGGVLDIMRLLGFVIPHDAPTRKKGDA